MADLTWIGDDSGNEGDFETANNWIVTSTGSTSGSAPANSDTLRFNDRAAHDCDVNITSTSLTGLEVIVTPGMRYKIGSDSDALEADISTLTYAGQGMYGKFSGTIPSPEVEAGSCLFTGGTIGGTSMEVSNGNVEVGSSADAATGTWKVRSGNLSMKSTSTTNAPDIVVAPGATVQTERDTGTVYNAGRTIYKGSAGAQSGDTVWNFPGGHILHDSSGDLRTLEALPQSTYRKGPNRTGSINTLNEWDGSIVHLIGQGGTVDTTTTNNIGAPTASAGAGTSGTTAGIDA